MADGGIDLPAEYAPRRVRERLVPWWRGAAGDALRTYGPRIWPGVPLVVLMAWSITSTGPTERGPEPDFVRGLWGVERDRLDALARAARPYLNREVRIGLDERDYLRDLEAQVVCGLLTYKKHFDGLMEDVDPRVVAVVGRESAAAARFAAMAYSSGGGRIEPLLDALGPHLLDAPVQKWPLAIAQRVASHEGDTITSPEGDRVGVAKKWRTAHALLRVEARALGACLLAEAVLPPLEAVAVVKWADDWARRPEHAALVARLKARADG